MFAPWFGVSAFASSARGGNLDGAADGSRPPLPRDSHARHQTSDPGVVAEEGTLTRVLSCDPGYAAFGFACLFIDGQSRVLVDSGEWITTKEHGSEAERVALIVKFFVVRLEEFRPEVVGIEAFTFQRSGAAHGQNSKVARHMNTLIGRLTQACAERSIPVLEIETKAAKLALGLSGKVSKGRVRKAAEMMFCTPVREHAADAIAVGIAAERKWRRAEIEQRARRTA